MNLSNAEKLRVAANAREIFDDLEGRLADYVSKPKDMRYIKGKLSAQGVNLVVEVLGFSIVARPRMVRSNSGEYFDEYAFATDIDGGPKTLYVFFLSQNGTLLSSIDFEEHGRGLVSQVDEVAVARIVTEVASALIDSTLLKPTAIAAPSAP